MVPYCMANLKEKIEIELENIDRLFKEMPDYSILPDLSTLELAGVATLLHNLYNGIENILKQILYNKNIDIPNSESWHKDLLNLSVSHNIISDKLKEKLGEYLAFRHFFGHAYALDLFPERMDPLVKEALSVYQLFKDEIKTFM